MPGDWVRRKAAFGWNVVTNGVENVRSGAVTAGTLARDVKGLGGIAKAAARNVGDKLLFWRSA